MIAVLAATLALSLPTSRQEISQADLAIRVLDTCDRNPTALNTIRAINIVVGLGPELAKRTLDKYFEDTQQNNKGGLYLFVRCIFDIPRRPGFLSTPRLGHFNPMPPPDLKQSPRFPFSLVGDIPLTISGGTGAFSGFPEPIGLHYRRLSSVAQLRKKPLVPTDQPWRVLGGTTLPDNVDFGRLRIASNKSILDLVKTAYRPKGYVYGKPSMYTITPSGWRYVVAEMEKTRMHWDRGREMYVRADGSVLPAPRQ